MTMLSVNLPSGPINVPAGVDFHYSSSFANGSWSSEISIGASAHANARSRSPRRRQPTEQEVATPPFPYEESPQRQHFPVCYGQIFESLGLVDLGSLCASTPAWAGPIRRFILKAALPKLGVNLPPPLPAQTAASQITEDMLVDDAAILALGPLALADHGIDAQGKFCKVCEEHLHCGVARHLFGQRGRRHNRNLAIWTNAYDAILTHGWKFAYQGMQFLSGSAVGKVYCNACQRSMDWREATWHLESKVHKTRCRGFPQPPMQPSDDVLKQLGQAGRSPEAIRNGGNSYVDQLMSEFVLEPVEMEQQPDIPAQDPIVKEEFLDVVLEDRSQQQ